MCSAPSPPPLQDHHGFGAKAEVLNVNPDLTTMTNCNSTALVQAQQQIIQYKCF